MLWKNGKKYCYCFTVREAKALCETFPELSWSITTVPISNDIYGTLQEF